MDGFFFDIAHPQECACFRCKADMLAQGLDPADVAQRKQSGMDVMYRFMDEMSAFVRSFDADATIFLQRRPCRPAPPPRQGHI
ncbi:MAG: hypothetical protein R2873_29475 [Caldilineaceae bacterium]